MSPVSIIKNFASPKVHTHIVNKKQWTIVQCTVFTLTAIEKNLIKIQEVVDRLGNWSVSLHFLGKDKKTVTFFWER